MFQKKQAISRLFLKKKRCSILIHKKTTSFTAYIPHSSVIGSSNFQFFKIIDLEPRVNYRMSLKIKVQKPIIINIKYVLAKTPWTAYASTQIKAVPDKENYTCILKPEPANKNFQTPGSIRFFLGDLDGEKIQISDLELIREN